MFHHTLSHFQSMRLRYFLNVTILSLYSNYCCFLIGRWRASSFICFCWDCVDNSDNYILVILHNLLYFLLWGMEWIMVHIVLQKVKDLDFYFCFFPPSNISAYLHLYKFYHTMLHNFFWVSCSIMWHNFIWVVQKV